MPIFGSQAVISWGPSEPKKGPDIPVRRARWECPESGDEDAGDMTGWAIAGREIADGVGFAAGRNGD
jgi:hypothetical protein